MKWSETIHHKLSVEWILTSKLYNSTLRTVSTSGKRVSNAWVNFEHLCHCLWAVLYLVLEAITKCYLVGNFWWVDGCQSILLYRYSWSFTSLQLDKWTTGFTSPSSVQQVKNQLAISYLNCRAIATCRIL